MTASLPHRRIHNLLLIQKLLTLREGASPFTLILDSVEQSAKPVLRHYVCNAKVYSIFFFDDYLIVWLSFGGFIWNLC